VGYVRNPLTNVNRNLGHSTKKKFNLARKMERFITGFMMREFHVRVKVTLQLPAA
jgi:hypothetical protein